MTARALTLPAPFVTEGGAVLAGAEIAYEEYGNPMGPVVLLGHGGLSSQRATDWWGGLIGPGRPFDTDRFRILSPNALGGMYGSCSPLSIDPATGRNYGPTFPAITLVDQVRFQAAFLDALAVGRLACVAGPSMGSLHALTFAATYPHRVDRAVAVATAARMTASGMAMHHFMMNTFRADPGFLDGWYPPGTPLAAARIIWQVMKLYYTSEQLFRELCAQPHAPGAQSRRSARAQAFLTARQDAGSAPYDANCFIASLNAINSYDLGEGFASLEEGVRRIQCPVLLVSVDTDNEFPPREAEELAAILNAARPGQATTALIRSMWGHLGCVQEPEQLGAILDAWLAE